MKRRSMFVTMMMVLCLVFTNICFFPGTAYAKGITSEKQVKKLAKKEVKGAKVVDVETDYEKGSLVYDVELSKGKKEYNLVFRASDAKLISSEWELKSQYVKKGKGKLISVNKAKKLAGKQVKDGSITSIVQKRSNGIDIYKVKMKTSDKKYELKLHARTGTVLEYEWDLVVKTAKNTDINSGNDGEYIGLEQAKQIALETVGSGKIVKAKFDIEDGQPIYEVEIVEGMWEYEFEIHAVTGKILEHEVEHIYD